MDFTDSITYYCEKILNKVNGKLALAEATKLYDSGELEKAKKKLLSIGKWELSENAIASYLLAKIYLETINNVLRNEDKQKTHKEIVKYLSTAIMLKHEEAKYLYYQHYDGYGNVKNQVINDNEARYTQEHGKSMQSKEIIDLQYQYFDECIRKYNDDQRRNEWRKGTELTSDRLEIVRQKFPFIKKEDIIFYYYGAYRNWTMFCSNHYYDSSGLHGNLRDIVRVERFDLTKPMVVFYADGKTSLVRYPREKTDFANIVKKVQEFAEHLSKQGNEFYSKRKYDKAFPYLLESADVYNNADAQSKLALFYKNGYYVKKDDEKASYYHELAKKNNITANQSKSAGERKDILKVLEKFANKLKLHSVQKLSKDNIETVIKKNRLNFSSDYVLYGKVDKIDDSFEPKWLLTKYKLFYTDFNCTLKISYDDLKYAFENEYGGFTVCHQNGKFKQYSLYYKHKKYLSDLVNLLNDISLAVNGIDYTKTMRKYNVRDLYAALYKGYHFDKYESKEQDNLFKIIKELDLNTFDIKSGKDILGVKLFDKSNKNMIVFAHNFAVYTLDGKKNIIYYDTLKNVTYDSKIFTIHYLDGSTQTFEHSNKETFRISNTLNRFACIAHKDVLSVDGKTMITHENVDFSFVKYTSTKELPKDFKTLEKMYLGYASMPGDDPYYSGEALDCAKKFYELEVDRRNSTFITHNNVDYKFKKYVWGNVPRNFDELEKMYLGYTTIPFNHPEQIGEKELNEIKEFMLRADLDDKYLQMQFELGLLSAQYKMMSKRINDYKNLSSIVSEIWYKIIMDYKDKVKEPYISEWRIAENGESLHINISWFEEIMNTLKERAKKEIVSNVRPVAYAAYQVFNPTLNELEKSRFATYEGKPISEVLGKSPSAADVMKLFNIPTHQFYSAMSNINSYAWLFFHSCADMQEVTTKTEYLPFSSVAEDYSLDDLKYMANYKRYMEEEYKQTGKVDADSHGAQMVRQFNEDRRIETVTKGEWFSSFLRYTDARTNPQEMSYIDSSDVYRTPDARHYGTSYYAWAEGKSNRAKKYLSMYEEMSDSGYLLFTCFLCEKGETEYSGKYFERKEEQYDKLRKRIDYMYKNKE